MTGVRRLYLDACPGEARGVVTLDGRPERLLLEREGDDSPRIGARYLGRVAAVAPRFGLVKIEIAADSFASLRFGGEAPPPEGAWIDVEVTAEAQGGKPPLVRRLGPADAGRAAMIAPPPSIRERLAAFAPEAKIVEGPDARDVADEAEDAALACEHALDPGVVLTVETTRALVAVDVDVVQAAGAGSPSRTNLFAVAETARLLRLKALGGLIVIDLAGFPKDRARLLAAAADAFAADGPQVVIGAISRFGALELSKPRREQPIAERLTTPDGRPTVRTLAQRLVRRLERDGRADPGARLLAVASPEVASELTPLLPRLGPRFQVRGELGRDALDADIRTL